MKKNEGISILQGLCLFFAGWMVLSMLFFEQEGPSDFVYQQELIHSVKTAGLSILMVLSIIALQLFKDPSAKRG